MRYGSATRNLKLLRNFFQTAKIYMLFFIMPPISYQTGARIHGVSDLPSGLLNGTTMLQSDIVMVSMALVKAREAEEANTDY